MLGSLSKLGFKGILHCFNKLRPKCSLNTAYIWCIAEKRCFGLVSPQIEVFWRRFFTFEFPGAVLKCDLLRLQCQALLLSNTMLDNERGPGIVTVTRHISRWRRREIQLKWKIALRKPRFVDLQDQRFVFLLCNTPNLCSKSIFCATCWNSGGSL